MSCWRPWNWCLRWACWTSYGQSKCLLETRKSVLWGESKIKAIGFILLINERHQFLENMKENHINKISYLIFISSPPWDRMKTGPSLAVVGGDGALFSYCSSRASEDAGHLLVSRELLLRLPPSCPVTVTMLLHALLEKSPISPSHSELLPEHASGLTK